MGLRADQGPRVFRDDVRSVNRVWVESGPQTYTGVQCFQPGLGLMPTPALMRATRTVSKLTPSSLPMVANAATHGGEDLARRRMLTLCRYEGTASASQLSPIRSMVMPKYHRRWHV